jgi:N-acetylglutamate synthase
LPKSKPQEFDLVADLELRLLTVWPAVTTHMIGGWAVRLAGGYTGRANSASAIVPGARLSEALLRKIIAIYGDAGLVPQVRVSPVAHAETAQLLQQHGFVSRGAAHTMIARLDRSFQPDARVALANTADHIWCVNVTSRQDAARRNPQALHAIVERIAVPRQFATVAIDGEAVGFGMAAIDRGWVELGSIIIDENHRGKGLGRALISTLLHWATVQAVDRAFLQVDVTNTKAIALYRSFAFDVLYDYDTVFLKSA